MSTKGATSLEIDQYAVYRDNNSILNHFKMSDEKRLKDEVVAVQNNPKQSRKKGLTIKVDIDDRVRCYFGSFKK